MLSVDEGRAVLAAALADFAAEVRDYHAHRHEYVFSVAPHRAAKVDVGVGNRPSRAANSCN